MAYVKQGFEPRKCENPKCKRKFTPHIHNQRICSRKECAAWKAKEHRKKYQAARKAELEARAGKIDMPTWAEGCLVGSTQWCPFPGVTNW